MSVTAVLSGRLRRRAAPGLLPWKIASGVVAGIVLLPILMIFLQWGSIGFGEREVWQHLLETRLGELVLNTVILVTGVGFGVTLLGVGLAWLTAMCDFPGRRLFDWMLMLPLAIPGYVMAFVFLGLLNYAGPVQTALRDWFGPGAGLPDVRGAPGVITVFSLVLYPYVYMLARAAFLSQGRGMMDAARALGLGPWRAFLQAAVPMARPAIVAGLALALMETLADFGAVAVFNYDTFTTAIYSTWLGLFNRTVAAQLASLLLLFVALVLVLEKKGRSGARYALDERRRSQRVYRLQGAGAWSAAAACALVLGIAFLLPLGQLLLWILEAGGSEIDALYSDLGHTLALAAIAAGVTVLIALLLAFVRRLPGGGASRRWMAASIRTATLGYALPGSVLAVGIMLAAFLVDRTLMDGARELFGLPLRPLVGSVFLLVLAYVTRFLAVAYAPVDSGLDRIRPSVLDAARSLGAGPARLLRRVYLPMLRPGLLTAATIVFVDVMKEMPATLIMRPFGWDTLAVQIYTMTAEGQWERAALPAVTLILAGLLPVMLLIRSSARRRESSPAELKNPL